MHWLFLSCAILLEIIGTTAMKASGGLTRVLPSIAMFVCYISAFSMLSLALKRIEVGIAYAIWSGIGTAAIAIIGIRFFDEVLSWQKVVFLSLIIVGVIGLHTIAPK